MERELVSELLTELEAQRVIPMADIQAYAAFAPPVPSGVSG